uniref:Photosystem II extrinsic protein U, chloroplastic n=1 Tax=Pyropia yezoensis TaxID=2788 RepID=PSBU_PYRYE|nr:RecName: Full=Photosystem II extrinsic protein U, chloroplastic; Short=PsbU; AltName: Full=Photosystem II 12 kDa extrinsic protein; Short=PS II complex 12 kDa extrinsic protein; AltName: Full=Protein PYP2; Flags: Precursor [Neopyropia yezoensis]
MDSTAFVGAAAPLRVAAAARSTICMAAADDKPVVSRRAALTGAAAAALAAVAGSLPALAETEYANVPFLGGSVIIDINNANVRAYAKYPGMYPTVAGLIATNGPFETVSDLYKIPGLTDLQIATLKKYEDKLVALTPTPEYELDKVNNGLYR